MNNEKTILDNESLNKIYGGSLNQDGTYSFVAGACYTIDISEEHYLKAKVLCDYNNVPGDTDITVDLITKDNINYVEIPSTTVKANSEILSNQYFKGYNAW